MAMFQIIRRTDIAAPLDQVWDFFARPENLDRLTPPDLSFRIVTADVGRMYSGQIIEYRIRIFPLLWVRWLTEIKHVAEGRYFVDEQRIGPYKFWHHEHRFESLPNGQVRMQDLVNYDVGWGWIGVLLNTLVIRRRLNYIFDYRQRVIAGLFGG